MYQSLVIDGKKKISLIHFSKHLICNVMSLYLFCRLGDEMSEQSVDKKDIDVDKIMIIFYLFIINLTWFVYFQFSS